VVFIYSQGDSIMPSVNVRLSLPDDSPCELFHTATKLSPYPFRQWQHQQPPIAEHPAIAQWMQSPFKEYLSLPQTTLPAPASAASKAGQVDAACLAALLQQPTEISSLELYLWVNAASGIAPGLHHYNKRTHRLEHFLAAGPLLPTAQLRQTMSEQFAALLFISGVITRVRLHHGERGYRYMLFETGRVLERLLTQAAALGLTLTLMPDFYDNAVNELLGLDGVEESALHLVGIQYGL
jgi:SagB-type dehydrogenase family enzyme